jgi:hypothetical protein
MNPKPNLLIALIISAGAVGIGLGVFQLYDHLKLPVVKSENAVNVDTTRGELIALQERDTDQDGLSDFDELYSYSTSPYLPDTDSDGIPDQTEIDANTDPNCPQGKVCRDQSVNDNANAGNTNALANMFELENTNVADGSANTNATITNDTIVNPTLDQVSNEELRDVLKKSGVPADTVDQMDDATLRQLYSEALKQENAGSNTNSTASNTNVNGSAGNTNANSNSGGTVNTNSVTVEDLQSLSAAEIRELLISSGIPSATLDQFDDATLKSIFLEAMTSSNTNTNQ